MFISPAYAQAAGGGGDMVGDILHGGLQKGRPSIRKVYAPGPPSLAVSTPHLTRHDSCLLFVFSRLSSLTSAACAL